MQTLLALTILAEGWDDYNRAQISADRLGSAGLYKT
jgi:hypothetical protein